MQFSILLFAYSYIVEETWAQSRLQTIKHLRSVMGKQNRAAFSVRFVFGHDLVIILPTQTHKPKMNSNMKNMIP